MSKKFEIYEDIKEFINEDNLYLMYNSTEITDEKDIQENYEQQREKYGFDERELWDLDITTILWLYAHLKRFKEHEYAGDLNGEYAHEYNVKIISKINNKYIYNEEIKDFEYIEKTLKIGNIIDIILEYFKSFLINEEDYNDDIQNALGREGMRLYGTILPSLWT